jgi:hypothetical protein
VHSDFGKRVINPSGAKICQFPHSLDFISQIKWCNFLLICFAFLTSPSKKRVTSPMQLYTVVVRTELSVFIDRGIISLCSEENNPLSLLCVWMACLGGWWSQGNLFNNSLYVKYETAF